MASSWHIRCWSFRLLRSSVRISSGFNPSTPYSYCQTSYIPVQKVGSFWWHVFYHPWWDIYICDQNQANSSQWHFNKLYSIIRVVFKIMNLDTDIANSRKRSGHLCSYETELHLVQASTLPNTVSCHNFMDMSSWQSCYETTNTLNMVIFSNLPVFWTILTICMNGLGLFWHKHHHILGSKIYALVTSS